MDDTRPSWQKAIDARRTPEQKRKDIAAGFVLAFEELSMQNSNVTTADLQEHLGVCRRTVLRRVKADAMFFLEQNPQDFYAPAFVRRKP